MKLTVIILLLPVVIFFGGMLLFSGSSPIIDAGHATMVVWLTIWMFSTLICFGWGFFIFRRHRILACCCFAVVLLQLVLFIPPLFEKSKGRFSEVTWPNKSPEPTAVGACRSAIAVHAASRRWLSFLR